MKDVVVYRGDVITYVPSAEPACVCVCVYVYVACLGDLSPQGCQGTSGDVYEWD